MRKTPIFNSYVIMISYFIISFRKQSNPYPAFITRFKASFIIYSHDKISIKVLFCHRSKILILIKNCNNELINCIFSSVKNDWFAKFTINIHNFFSKTARNMILIFFSIGSITIFIDPLHPI